MELVSYGSSLKLPPLKNDQQLQPKSPKSANTGLQYMLTDGRVPHNIPHPNALKSNIEADAGLIDTWPAHSTNQRNANMHLTSSQNSFEPTATTRKPKFLESLENFLFRELKVLGCTDSSVISEPRLQAFREVFEYLIEEFKTYKPLLSAIKNEYELMLSTQREKIRELEPLKQMLVTLAEQSDHKLMDFREQERIEIKQLKDEKKKLFENIMQLQQNMMALQVQVEKLQNELSLEHEKYRDEYDKKKLLIADLNDLRYQQEEAKLAELQREKKRLAERNQIIDGNIGNLDENDTENDNPANLKLALKICRQNLTDAQLRLSKIEIDYGDVIPRREYLALESVYNELISKGGNLEKDYKSLKFENTHLKETCKQLETKLHDAIHHIEHMKGNSTPRPEWNKCADAVDGGQDRWKALSLGKSSNQIVDILLNEFSGANQDTNTVKFFDGLGTGEHVPLYLRFEGQIKNRNLNRRDTATTICDIWKEKAVHNSQRPPNESPIKMSEFVYHYFKSRFSADKIAYEWCYNLKNACDRFVYNDYIQFFKGVLDDEIDEEIYHHERRSFVNLFELLTSAERKERGSQTTIGFISKPAFVAAIKDFFDSKSNEDLDIILKAADEEFKQKTTTDGIDYRAMLSEDDEGRIGTLLTAVKKQLHKDRLQYASDVKNSLTQKTASVNEFRRAVIIIDQSITDKEIERYLRWCFGNTRYDPTSKPLETEHIIKRLENCCIFEHDTQVGRR